jgi:carboxypeptidase C (cathepsin A)
MNIQTLKTEIAGESYAGKSDAEIATMLNASTVTVNAPGTYLNELGVLDVLGPTNGEAFLAAIEASQNAEGLAVLKRAVRRLQTVEGLDVGNATLQAQLQALATDTVVTQAAVNAIIAHGSKQISRAEQLGLETVGDGHVKSAKELA